MNRDPLSEDEIEKLRELLDAQQRAEWFWKQARIWATWVSATIVGTYAIYETIIKAIRGTIK